MLASASTVEVVAEAFRQYRIDKAVVDPVMVATSGARLLPENAVKILCDKLLPETYLLTPNIPEAKLIVKEAGQPAVDIKDLDGFKQLAKVVQKLGPKYVLIKGGHLPLTADRKVATTEEEKHIAANVLYGEDVDEVIELPYQSSRNTHGTGCTLACMSIRRESIHR
jgi:hydroxymethylpyrimidine kinase/phosphomethylpyrimidine kinase